MKLILKLSYYFCNQILVEFWKRFFLIFCSITPLFGRSKLLISSLLLFLVTSCLERAFGGDPGLPAVHSAQFIALQFIAAQFTTKN
jgi:uncharacterized membrane protein